MWLYCCSLWLWTSKQTKGSQLPSSGWNQPGFGHPLLLVLLLSRNPSQNSLSHSSGHILSPKASQRRLSAGCFAISRHSNSSILLFFLSLVGAVRRKVVATETRLHLTPWSLTGRRWIFLFFHKATTKLLCVTGGSWRSWWFCRHLLFGGVCAFLAKCQPKSQLPLPHLGLPWQKCLF